jgi:hypothetical protein
MKLTDFFSDVNDLQLLTFRDDCIKPYLNADGTLTVWTSIPSVAWNDLQRSGVLHCPNHRADEDYRLAYGWMVQCMAKVGLKPPADSLTPFWCWIHTVYPRRAPQGDMRDTRQYLLELKINPTRVLASDFHLWHYALNGWPLTRSFAASEALDLALESLGLNYFRQKPLPAPHQQVFESSWRHIFNLGFHQDDEPCEPFSDRKVQAVFWELRFSDIISVIPPSTCDWEQPQAIAILKCGAKADKH